MFRLFLDALSALLRASSKMCSTTLRLLEWLCLKIKQAINYDIISLPVENNTHVYMKEKGVLFTERFTQTNEQMNK